MPQGSILGPLLFIIFVNDISHIDSKYQPILFADDTSVSFTCEKTGSIENACLRLNKTMTNWFSANGLKLNLDKSSTLLFAPRHSCAPKSIEGLKLNTETKYLGVTIDATFSWTIDADKLCKKLRHADKFSSL